MRGPTMARTGSRSSAAASAFTAPGTSTTSGLQIRRASPAVLAAGVGDGHLVDAVAAAEDLGRYLRLEVEALRLDGDPFEHLAVEQLVAGLQVGQVGVEEDVRGQRQEAVPEMGQVPHCGPF